jgi:hypothetical protein
MKLIKLSFIIAIAVMAIIGVSTTSYAFHAGGVASCESCHTMHNSLLNGNMSGTGNTTAGAAGTANPAGSAVFLLRGTDQSSTCLNCHEGPTLSSYHVSTPNATIAAAANKAPVNRGPGGDFGWLRAAANTTTNTAISNRRGHNIVAADFGYTSDIQNTYAPGGTYLASQLNCISCHNPHNQLRRTSTDGTVAYVKPAIGTNAYAIVATGSNATVVPTTTTPVGPFRFLRGAGLDQAPKSTPAVNFTADPPVVISPSTYNRSEGASDTHVAYGSGMSAWCANCHAAFYDSVGDSNIGNSGHPHPTNKAIGATMAGIYNAYVGSGNLTNVTGGYSSLVPVEQGTSDYSVLASAATNTALGGTYAAADANAKVMCLSCHRAHAGGFQNMTRFNVAGNTTNAAGTDFVVASGLSGTTAAQAAYYERNASVFGGTTKQLCNKCHNKD